MRSVRIVAFASTTALLAMAAPVHSYQGADLAATSEPGHFAMSRLDAGFDTFVPPPYRPDSLEVEREIIDLRILARDARTPRILGIIALEAQDAHQIRAIFEDRGILPSAAQYPALWKYLEALENEAGFFSARDMIRFNRAWPADISDEIHEIAGRAEIGPYPSGVSARAFALAYGLSIINPECSALYFETSSRISKRREIAGLNHASDTAAGEVLASRVVDALVSGGALSQMIEALQDEIENIQKPGCEPGLNSASQ